MKLGLALGGGGAKGFAHIGVLKVLEEAGITVDAVAGTSVGALVGAVYASGNIRHLERESIDITLTDIPLLLSPAWSLHGLFSGKNALDVLSQLLSTELIEDLTMPFAAVSADLNTGRSVVLKSGDLRRAVRASISIPALFTPVLIDDMLLIDGGILEPVPVRHCRELGAEAVIAIDLFGNQDTPPVSDTRRSEKILPAGLQNALNYLKSISSKLPWGERQNSENSGGRKVPTIIDILEKTLAVSQRQLTEYRLREHAPDITIRPALSDIGLLDFHRGKETIERGMLAAREVLPAIRKCLNACT
jgi:NTE family protein